MGNSVILDPFDLYRFQQGLGKEFPRLLEEGMVELNVTGGVILPNLKMTGKEERCVFLDREGRCSIHGSRPGLCRLFPLGRFYENGDFKYFLQTGQCEDSSRTKIKVSKWIDTPDQGRNHEFICKWHSLLSHLEEVAETEDMENAKRLNLRLLQLFFMTPYEPERDFYEQFEERLGLF